MPKVTPISWKKFEAFLLFIGCEFVRQSGGHRVYRKPGLARSIIMPAHGGDLPVFVIKSNLRTLGMDTQQYLEVLRRVK